MGIGVFCEVLEEPPDCKSDGGSKTPLRCSHGRIWAAVELAPDRSPVRRVMNHVRPAAADLCSRNAARLINLFVPFPTDAEPTCAALCLLLLDQASGAFHCLPCDFELVLDLREMIFFLLHMFKRVPL